MLKLVVRIVPGNHDMPLTCIAMYERTISVEQEHNVRWRLKKKKPKSELVNRLKKE